mgnify:FL=1
MLSFLKRNILITILFLSTLSLGFLTFLTFIDKSFIELSEKNLQTLLILNIILIILFIIFIFFQIKNSLKENLNVRGSVANKKYVIFFSLFTLIPSLLISIFSLFIFSYALNKYFDTKITTAVNNSYEIVNKYVDEKRNKIESDIILIAYDLNRVNNLYKNNPSQFKKYLNTQRLIRNIDNLYLVDGAGNLLLSANDKEYIKVDKSALSLVLNDSRPLKMINPIENKSAAIIKLENFENTFLYIIKFLEKDISKFLSESKEAIDFYYTVENQNLGIKISFIIIYLIIVTLLLFLSISIAIRFSSRFFISINNLIIASQKIGKGDLNTKVPEIKTDREMEILNKNFNSMIDQLKSQQHKLILSERHSAWEDVSRKLAHEIKNPLTPIQLIVDNLKSKYQKSLSDNDKFKYQENLQTINKQIKQIENLVNEFSDFARMPKPMFRENNLIDIINTNLLLLKKVDETIQIETKFNNLKELILLCDYEQISRCIFNLVKNSIESIQEKALKTSKIEKKIIIEIEQINDYIKLIIIDNGTGFPEDKKEEIIKPYYTTKEKGSGLGLSIVSKIINDHNGSIIFKNIKSYAQIEILLPNQNAN